jgi:hypothetical protein
MEEYLEDDWVGSSALKKILDTPADYQAALDQTIETKSTLLGTAIHTMVLEPEKFLEQYLPQNEDWGPKNKKPGKQLWDDLKTTAKDLGLLALPYEDFQLISQFKDAGLRHIKLQEILSAGTPEVTAFAKGYKARCDWITDDGFIWDLKTSSKPVDNASLSRTIFNYRYHFQAAHHTWVFEQAGVDITGFGWIFVSTGTPYPHIVIRKASEKLMAIGRADHEYAMKQHEHCKKHDEWPGHPEEIEEIDLPYYAEKDYND